MRNRVALPKLTGAAVLAAWIAGAVIIAALCWFLTANVRAQFLLRAVNRVLDARDLPYRLEAPLAPGPGDRAGRTGNWFSLADGPRDGSGPRAYVFSLIDAGFAFPCAAIVETGGAVRDLVILSARPPDRDISPGVRAVYIRRIERMVPKGAGE